MEECQRCRKSAAGPDGFEPAEMGMLPWGAYVRMTEILNLVEEGEEWPRGMQEARAAFMEKEAGNVSDPLKFRVLKILPALYRRWAAVRLRNLEEWVGEWSTADIYAGGGTSWDRWGNLWGRD